MEYPEGVGLFLPLSQELGGGRWQEDIPSTSVGLGVTGYQSATVLLVQSAVDFQCTVTVIEVRPHESADLAQPQDSGQLGVEEIVPDLIGSYCFYKCV